MGGKGSGRPKIYKTEEDRRQVDPYGLKILTAGNRPANRFILRQVNLHRGDEAP